MRAFVLAALLIPSSAQAQIINRCDTHAAMIAKLLEKYREQAIGIGLQLAFDEQGKRNDLLMELLTSKDGATWSIIATSRHGESCLLANGSDWTVLVPVELGVDTGVR